MQQCKNQCSPFDELCVPSRELTFIFLCSGTHTQTATNVLAVADGEYHFILRAINKNIKRNSFYRFTQLYTELFYHQALYCVNNFLIKLTL